MSFNDAARRTAPIHRLPESAESGGWAAERLHLIEKADGVCVRCGFDGADTAMREWASPELLAAHTRCVVGLGPPPAANRVPDE
jgi:hypothetical protein